VFARANTSAAPPAPSPAAGVRPPRRGLTVTGLFLRW
jgi:hypothetical protein